MSIRKQLGVLKWILLDGGWPEYSYNRRLDALYRRALKQAAVLPPVPAATNADVEIHMLCGTKHAPIALWAWWSLLRFCDGRFGAVTHSDGSLTPEDIARFQKAIPGMRVEAEKSLDEIFGPFGGKQRLGNIMDIRGRHKLAKKITDFHVLSKAKVVIILDSDILFFKKPVEVLDAIDECLNGGTHVVYNEDVQSNYMATPEVLSKHYQQPVPSCFNSGLVVFPRFDGPILDRMEAVLAKAEEDWRKNYFLEQTVSAIMAGQFGATPLPKTYFVADGGHAISPDAICVHYAGKGNRPDFFGHGIPKLLTEIRA